MLGTVFIPTATIIVTLPIDVTNSIAALRAVLVSAALRIDACPEAGLSDFTGTTSVVSAVTVLRTARLIFAVARCDARSTKPIVLAGRVIPNRATLSIATINSVRPRADRAIRELVGRIKC
jgi:hypothetical protein